MLRTSLPYLVIHGLARSTTTKYQSGWSRWVTWCGTKTGISCRPADPYFVAIYLNGVFFIKHTKGAIRDAMFSINWGHRVMGLDSPTENSLVKLAYEGALRLCGGSVNKKDALPIDIVKDVVDAYRLGPDNLLHMRTIVVILLGFSGFFRISELLSVTLKYVNILDDHLQIFLNVSKCDQHRQGNEVIIARTGTSYCPVAFLERFLNLAELDVSKDGEAYLVPRLHKSKHGYKASTKYGISTDTIRSNFNGTITPFARNNANYSLHSLRSGGASRASDRGVTDRLIAKQGRWSSEKGKNGYIKDGHEARKSVTLALGL